MCGEPLIEPSPKLILPCPQSVPAWHDATAHRHSQQDRRRGISLVTRDPKAIERFVGKVGRSVVKPLYGAKGRNVFMIEDEGEANLAQMTEAVLEDGYAIVQEFVDGGEDGDARIFLLEGQILERHGKPAAFRRVPTG